MADRVDDRFGGVDALVNNARIRVDPRRVTEADEERWDSIVGVNLKGAVFCSKYLIPLMDGGEAIVNVSSVGASTAREGWTQ